MSIRTFMRGLSLLVLLLLVVVPASAKPAEDSTPPEKLDIQDDAPKKETLLDLIFGSGSQLPTERGILIIDAFDDKNRNGIQDADEPALNDEISCVIDEISYTVPAFIPGLDYNNRYKVRCSGKNYRLYTPPSDIFIERRGHVIEISLPCGKLD